MQFSTTDAWPSQSHPTWEQSFPSKTLGADIRTLMDENFELEAARARVEQAAAAFGIAKATLYPSVKATVSIDRSRIKEDEEDGLDETRNTIAFGAALNWELDIWGRLKARKKSTGLSLDEKRALADRTALDLQTLLVECWIAHHAARKLERVLREQHKTNRQYLNLTGLRLATGQGSSLDVLQQQERLMTTERTLPAIVSKRCRSANAYAVLLGRFPDSSNLARDAWPVLQRLSDYPSPRQLMVARPDLRAAFLSLQAADQEVAAAIADRLPRLSIGLTAAASGRSLSHIGDGSLLRVAGGLLAPVFDAGRRKARVAERKAQAREALVVLEQAMRVAVREVEDAAIREGALFDEQRLLQEEIAIAMETVGKATLQYVNGQESFLAVLAALAKQQTLQQDEITVQRELLINRCRLLKALGAQWSRLS